MFSDRVAAVVVGLVAGDVGAGECRSVQEKEVSVADAGVKADVDVYHTNIHAFDMLYPENDQSIKAIKKFELCFAEAIEKAM